VTGSRNRVMRAYEQDFGTPTGGNRTNRPTNQNTPTNKKPKPKTPVDTGWGKATRVGK